MDVDDGVLAAVPESDRHRAHDLVLGVRRHLFLLDAVLRQYVRDKVGAVPLPIREALRLGIYDLLFHDRVPVPVVVAETVDLAGKDPKHRGFVNAVLRRISESFTIVAEPGDLLERAAVWTAPGRVARFNRPVLPEPSANIGKHLSTLYTLPEFLVTTVLRLLPLEYEEFFRACAAPLPVTLRPARRSGGLAALQERLAGEGVTVLAVRDPVVEIRSERPLAELEVVRGGFAMVQDRTAAEVAPFLAPEPGERILDLCAAPGGKAVHLAELMDDRGEVVAGHLGPDGGRRIQENANRLGIAGLRLHDLGPKGRDLPTGPFDRVLVDTPCSNTGVLMKRVDARYRAQPKELEQLGELQLRLLRRGAGLVRPGGLLAYSTCSVLPAENHVLVRRFLQVEHGFELLEERLRFPHRTLRDGGYMARLRRK